MIENKKNKNSDSVKNEIIDISFMIFLLKKQLVNEEDIIKYLGFKKLNKKDNFTWKILDYLEWSKRNSKIYYWLIFTK